MNTRFIIQPLDCNDKTSTIGSEIEKAFKSRAPFFREVWIVSAFANYQGLVRLLPHMKKSIDEGAVFHFIIGIDQQGTSKEALEVILSLGTDAKLVKNRLVGHTFHPKVYLFEAKDKAIIFIGSSNLTEGGIYRNYEANVFISYDLNGPDNTLYRQHKNSLSPFLKPAGRKTITLSKDVITRLESRGDIISELQKRVLRKKILKRFKPNGLIPASPFGVEQVPPPPPLPKQFIEKVLRIQTERRVGKSIRNKTITPEPAYTFQTNAFYLQLNKLQGKTIPGEARIPIAARDVAKKFWEWPEKYATETRRTGQHPRKYLTWKPKWKIIDTANPLKAYIDEVRMYEYEDSKDFRFYSKRLVSMGADNLDIVRITKTSPSEDAVYQCELAKKGSNLYSEWDSYCTIPIRNSNRRFGFA